MYEVLLSVILIIVLITYGINGIVRKRIMFGSPPEGKLYTGKKAVVRGWLAIILAMLFIITFISFLIIS